MISKIQKNNSSKFMIKILITIMSLIYIGSSIVYAKTDPNDVRNKPHNYDKFVCGTRADHDGHSMSKLVHASNMKRISDLQLIPSISADFDEGEPLSGYARADGSETRGVSIYFHNRATLGDDIRSCCERRLSICFRSVLHLWRGMNFKKY